MCWGTEGLFPIDAAFGRHPVPAVGVDDAIAGDLPQPRMERHDGLRRYPAAAGSLRPAPLHHVADVHSPLDAVVQTHLHEPTYRARCRSMRRLTA